jgi:hypothetical protein
MLADTMTKRKNSSKIKKKLLWTKKPNVCWLPKRRSTKTLFARSGPRKMKRPDRA